MTKIIEQVPEVPVKETWEWLTDVLQSYDGTEQRISLRGGAPRYKLDLALKATNNFILNQTWQRLITSRSKAWVPEYHLFTLTTAKSNSGSTRLYFDPNTTDIRAGENIYIMGYGVVQVTTMETDGCNLEDNLTSAINKDSIIAPAFIMIIENNPTSSMGSVNTVADFNISGLYNKKRTSLYRPGVSDPLTYWNSEVVLDVRPLATSSKETILEDNVTFDNGTSEVTIYNKWDEAKISSQKAFLINKNTSNCQNDGLKSIDYWRWFFHVIRGSGKKFWLPTYRNDLICLEDPEDEGSTILVEGFTYAQDIFAEKATHVYLEIATAQGTHRCEVESLGSAGQNTEVNFTPALPSGWVNVERVSFLVPSRLDGDKVEWEHYHLHSILNLNFRSAENVE